ncbi:hypothetical protein [Thermococcus sp.]|uniref:hypothetical protein n=1 Tax=Thermococcus sp. TaxID=35749 RepID=UPI0025CC637F|nr:hypothetical protein [Thermococcus sp.]
MSVLNWILGMLLLGAMLSILYDILFRPWRLVEQGLKDAEKQLKLLDGRFAKLHAFIIAPWLRGDVERTREFVSKRIELKKAELEAYRRFFG